MNPVAGAVALAVGSISLTAIAQEEGPGRGFFEEIVVTATRRTTDVQDVPYNIAAFSGETLERQRIESLGQFARWVPGLTLTDQGARDADLLTVRGLNASSITAPELFLGNTGGETVATYVGEIPLYIDLRPYDIERVEVLIGPQGTLYGAGTLAGAVRYIPARPNFDGVTLDTHAKGYVLDESDDIGWGGDLTLNVPLVDDVLAFRGTLGYVEEAGFIDYNFLVREPGVSNPEPDFNDPDDVAANLRSEEDADTNEVLTARAALLWNMTDDLQAILTYHYQNADAGARTINHTASFGTDEYTSGHRYLEPNERENQLVSLELTADFKLPIFGPVELTSATGFSQYDEQGQRDQTDLLLNFEYGYEDFPSFAAFTREESEEETFTQELRLVSTGDSPLSWIVGFFYYDWEQDAISQEFTPGIPEFFGIAPPPLPTGDLEFQQLTKEDITETAVFGEIGYQITDRWQITGGLRWFDYDDDVAIAVDIPLIDIVDSPFETAKTDDSDTTWKINTSYDFEEASIYVTVGEGYRLGGVNVFEPCETPLPPGQNVCLLPNELFFDVDRTTNYEAGIKSDWLDNALLFNLAVFHIEWEDVQVESISINGDVPITTNAAEATSTGVELQTRWQINDNWAMFGSYANTLAELSKDSPKVVGVRDPDVGLVDAFKGDQLPGTPEHQGSLNINYSRSVGNRLILDVDYGFTSISSVVTKIGQRGSGEELGGFTVHNASISLSSDTWTATLYSDNLTNKFARTGVRADRDFIDTLGAPDFTLRRYYHNVIRPRTIGLDFRYDFDF
jgi:outer membrane receptor protein involved in Fe transport